MEPSGPIRDTTETIFSLYLFPGFLQIFDFLAAIANAIVGLFGIDIKFLGL
ncbi:MAG: hypothetical protein MI923_10820 [Phycisphaerales bacterium]|nr:hypothetical protein [Phycisphaerales bacterium]